MEEVSCPGESSCISALASPVASAPGVYSWRQRNPLRRSANLVSGNARTTAHETYAPATPSPASQVRVPQNAIQLSFSIKLSLRTSRKLPAAGPKPSEMSRTGRRGRRPRWRAGLIAFKDGQAVHGPQARAESAIPQAAATASWLESAIAEPESSCEANASLKTSVIAWLAVLALTEED